MSRFFVFLQAQLKQKMGKKVKNQNFNTFLNPKEIAKFVIFLISADEEMMIDEIRMNRMVRK